MAMKQATASSERSCPSAKPDPLAKPVKNPGVNVMPDHAIRAGANEPVVFFHGHHRAPVSAEMNARPDTAKARLRECHKRPEVKNVIGVCGTIWSFRAGCCGFTARSSISQGCRQDQDEADEFVRDRVRRARFF